MFPESKSVSKNRIENKNPVKYFIYTEVFTVYYYKLVPSHLKQNKIKANYLY